MAVLLETRNMDISFGGVHAVNNVSFDVNEGEILALIGPNGSGKSTCVNLISGAYKLDHGEIRFNGKALTDKVGTYERARMGIYRTFQTPKPFAHMTVFDNLYAVAIQKYPLSGAKERVDAVLQKMRLYDQRDRVSSKVSIERRKWLDMARILVLEPKLIMMDEVMAGLNHTEMEESLDLVREINAEGVTVLFIEHVMKAVTSLCDRAIVLNEGELLFEGETMAALTNEKVVEVYIGKEAEHAED